MPLLLPLLPLPLKRDAGIGDGRRLAILAVTGPHALTLPFVGIGSQFRRWPAVALRHQLEVAARGVQVSGHELDPRQAILPELQLAGFEANAGNFGVHVRNEDVQPFYLSPWQQVAMLGRRRAKLQFSESIPGIKRLQGLSRSS